MNSELGNWGNYYLYSGIIYYYSFLFLLLRFIIIVSRLLFLLRIAIHYSNSSFFPKRSKFVSWASQLCHVIFKNEINDELKLKFKRNMFANSLMCDMQEKIDKYYKFTKYCSIHFSVDLISTSNNFINFIKNYK